MELDAQLIEERLRERAHDLRRGRGPAQPTPGSADASAPPPRQAPRSLRAAGPGWPIAARATCLDCAREIAAGRLTAVPDAARCMLCQRSFERDSPLGMTRPLRG